MAKMRRLLHRMLPKELRQQSDEEIESWLSTHLPLLKCSDQIQPPDILTIDLLCSAPQTMRAEALFLDLLKKWLIPDKVIEILSMRNMPFFLKGVKAHCYHLVQVEILVEKGQDYASIQNNLPSLAKELSLSLTSSKYAEYLLNIKAPTYEQKSTVVHHELRRVFHRFSSHFDQEIFIGMSRFLALSTPEFRQIRPARQITRIVTSHYLMRKQLLRALNKFPEKRQLMMRFMPTQLRFPFGTKGVLGLVITVGFIDKYENFDEAQIGLAVQKFIPDAQVVKGSFCCLRAVQDPVQEFYVELEKEDASRFTLEEIGLLKTELEVELKKRIEKLIPSVFMIRNEEETMRNILLLSQELRDLSDLPQVMISFESQSATDLIFTIILVRRFNKGDSPLKEIFQKTPGNFQFSSDRVQNVGFLNKNTPKEANVFHLSIPKQRSLLRADSSVNFYLARQQVVTLLMNAIGEVRDYNGGMILKQGELFSQFKQAFKDIANKNEELLENFFFGLSPIEMQATLPLASLETLFKLFLEGMSVEFNKKEQYFLKTVRGPGRLFVAIKTLDSSLEDELSKEFLLGDNFSKSLVKTKVHFQGHCTLSYIYENRDAKQQKEFIALLEAAIKRWSERIRRQQELRLSFIDLPPSLDPRQGGDELSSNLLKMLFDGLTRIIQGNKPALSIAKSVDITSDLMRYTFRLRTCNWSNGARVVAQDFEYSWKKVLSPRFETPFAYLFYPIKNARLAKEGKMASELIGVRAIDDETLVVELEYPTPEFLEMTAHALYSPVNHLVDRTHPNWAQGSGGEYVCNGPFILKKVYPNGGYELIKNPSYWDKESVKLERILITKDTSLVANEMFKNAETDWLGRPLRPWEPYFSRDSDEIIHGKPIGIHWCVFNVQRFPFHHPKIRQAFSLAVNRAAMSSHLLQGGMPAGTPLPLAHTQNYDASHLEGDIGRAVVLFEEGLKDLGLSRKDFPITTIIYTDLKSREAMAKLLQKQFQEAFDIPCRIEPYEFRQLFAKMTKGEYQIGTMSWKSWINDPIYTLNAFKYRSNTVNFSKWENIEYQKLLDAAQAEINPNGRLALIKEAEKVLLAEAPIIPLYYEVYNYMQKEYLQGALHTDTGNVDFKWASIQHD